MTTIRDKKSLRHFVDHATPDDRLHHSAGMGLGEPERRDVPILLPLIFLALLVWYTAPDLIAWWNGDAPVTIGRMK